MPDLILIVSETRLLALPADLLRQLQRCEKAYAAGLYYVTVPPALWAQLSAATLP